MTVLSILILAVGLNSAAVPAASGTANAAWARHAKVTLDRAIAADEPRLRQHTAERAIADSLQASNRSLARQIATVRVHSPFTVASIRERAKASLDRRVEVVRKELGARAVEQALRECRRDVSRMLAERISVSAPAPEIAYEAVNPEDKPAPFSPR